jgi:hypothetical protein
MSKIKSWETNYNGTNAELKIITDMLEANEKDLKDEYDWIRLLDHLYAVIREKPDYIQRCVDLGREYRVSNKRHKLN